MKAKIEVWPTRDDEYKRLRDKTYTAAIILIGDGKPEDVQVAIHQGWQAFELAADLQNRGLKVKVIEPMASLWPCGTSHHAIDVPCDCPKESG